MSTSRRVTKSVCGGVKAYNERSLAKWCRLCFTSPPLLHKTPWEMRSPQGPQKVQEMQEQISTMLQKKVITVLPPDSPGFNSNMFLVHKASGEWRPVIDFKQLNAHIFAPHFRSSVVSTVRKGDYSFKMDLQDAYFHVYQSIQMAESTYVLPSKTRYFSSEYFTSV